MAIAISSYATRLCCAAVMVGLYTSAYHRAGFLCIQFLQMRQIAKIKSRYWLKLWYVQSLCLLQFWLCCHVAIAASVGHSSAGAKAQLQQYDQLVLAISCEIESLHYMKKGQTLNTFCRQVAYNVAIFKPTDSYCTMVQNIVNLTSIFLQLLLSIFLVHCTLNGMIYHFADRMVQ